MGIGRSMTAQQWREFLQQWSAAWIARGESLPARVRKSRWLGSRPATDKQITQLEKRIGYQLPPSYRNFLLTTNGWSRTSYAVRRVRPAAKVDWLQNDNPQLLDSLGPAQADAPLDGLPAAEYFAYDGRPFFDAAHLRESLIIADPVAGDSMIYVLNPLVVAEDGEWEAWRFAHWIPGAERFPSFELLMHAEHESFLAASGKAVDSFIGPYEGVYAPDVPRRNATAIGRGKAKPRRLTIPELITQLEAHERKDRFAAAEQLFRELRPHDPEGEHPELSEPLGRIVRSSLETDVRSAAVAMLGSYGDGSVIPLLIETLDDPALTAIAISSIFDLSISMKDARIGDAIVRLMGTPRDHFVVDHAINILEELKDPRVAAIGLRLLDHAEDMIAPVVPPGANQTVVIAYQASSVRMKGAFAFARFAVVATNELVARLTHANAGIRVAATAALREDPKRSHQLEKHLRPLLGDPDPAVRQQAEMSIRFLEPVEPVEIPLERLTEIESQVESMLLQVKSQKSKRF